jgi:fumarylacetoacetate (FAA) hydrolase family protein
LVRLFDDRFTLDDVRNATLEYRIEGRDGFRLDGSASLRGLSRDPADLVAQACSEHQYPDGFVLFLGTPFAPVADRDVPGRGFTHKPGDVVSISASRLGTLRNRVVTCAAAPPWSFGIGALMANLASRGLLGAT